MYAIKVKLNLYHDNPCLPASIQIFVSLRCCVYIALTLFHDRAGREKGLDLSSQISDFLEGLKVQDIKLEYSNLISYTCREMCRELEQ